MGILETISQVHEKMEVFRQANHFSDKTELRKYCLSEFTVMDSTRTNRQWVNDLLRFFKENLTEELKLELSLLIKKKKMSATMKRKLREIIEPTEDSFDSLLFVG